MIKGLFKLFILFIVYSTVVSCSEQNIPDLPENPGNTNQGIASIDQTQINANGGGFIIRETGTPPGPAGHCPRETDSGCWTRTARPLRWSAAGRSRRRCPGGTAGPWSALFREDRNSIVFHM